MRVPFNHKIEEEIKDALDAFDDEYPGSKCEFIEAALRAFMALPEVARNKLLSGKPENRQICLDVLAALEVPLKAKKAVQRGKPSISA